LGIEHLTEQWYPDTASGVASGKSEAAGAPAIQLTDRIIRVGADIIASSARDVREGWVSEDEVARRVFEGMLAHL
jgi:hypothetical protein